MPAKTPEAKQSKTDVKKAKKQAHNEKEADKKGGKKGAKKEVVADDEWAYWISCFRCPKRRFDCLENRGSLQAAGAGRQPETNRNLSVSSC